jgi:hypothetical protein
VGNIVGFYEGLFLQHQQGAIDDDFFVNRFSASDAVEFSEE